METNGNQILGASCFQIWRHTWRILESNSLQNSLRVRVHSRRRHTMLFSSFALLPATSQTLCPCVRHSAGLLVFSARDHDGEAEYPKFECVLEAPGFLLQQADDRLLPRRVLQDQPRGFRKPRCCRRRDGRVPPLLGLPRERPALHPWHARRLQVVPLYQPVEGGAGRVSERTNWRGGCAEGLPACDGAVCSRQGRYRGFEEVCS